MLHYGVKCAQCLYPLVWLHPKMSLPLHLIGTRSYRTYKYQNTHLDAALLLIVRLF